MIRTSADTVKQVAHIHVQGASQHTLQDPVTGLEQMSHAESTDLLYDGGLYSSRLHLGQDLLLQHHLLLRLDDVLSSIGSSDHLQDLTCTAKRETLFKAFKLCVNMHLMSAWNGHRERKKKKIIYIEIDWIIQCGPCKLNGILFNLRNRWIENLLAMCQLFFLPSPHTGLIRRDYEET